MNTPEMSSRKMRDVCWHLAIKPPSWQRVHKKNFHFFLFPLPALSRPHHSNHDLTCVVLSWITWSRFHHLCVPRSLWLMMLNIASLPQDQKNRTVKKTDGKKGRYRVDPTTEYPYEPYIRDLTSRPLWTVLNSFRSAYKARVGYESNVK